MRTRKLDRTGILAIAVMVFALYLTLANLLWFTGVVTLPLGSALPDPTAFTLTAVAGTILIIFYKARREAEVK